VPDAPIVITCHAYGRRATLELAADRVMWRAWRGAPATREQIMASINSGLPLLRAMAENEGSKAIEELDRCISRGMALVPAE